MLGIVDLYSFVAVSEIVGIVTGETYKRVILLVEVAGSRVFLVHGHLVQVRQRVQDCLAFVDVDLVEDL